MIGYRIEQASAALVDALARGDVAGVGALYTEDATLLAPSARLITGRAAVAEFWRTGLSVGLARLELGVVGRDFRSEVVVEVGCYTLELEADPEPGVDRGSYLAVHRREPDGSWRRSADVFNPDSPARDQATRRTGRSLPPGGTPDASHFPHDTTRRRRAPAHQPDDSTRDEPRERPQRHRARRPPRY